MGAYRVRPTTGKISEQFALTLRLLCVVQSDSSFDNRGMFSAPQLLTDRLMARRLHVPLRWLRAEAKAGRIPHVQAERVLLFDASTVERVLIERARQAENGEAVS